MSNNKFNKYLSGLQSIVSEMERDLLHNQNLNEDNQNLNEEINFLRRDVNDLHSIIMLRDIGEKIPKKNRIVFIGTGQINENVVHAYIHFQKAIADKRIPLEDWEGLFIARTDLEKDLLDNYGYPCIKWLHQPELAYYLLQAKVAVFSSHLYSNWGDNLLSHCLSSAVKIELWHGLPAKEIGASCINNNLDFHFFARLLNDCVSKDHVCIQNSNQDVINEYLRAFPCAKQHITGDCRTDILFDNEFRQEFLQNKSNKSIVNWLNRNQDNIKVLYTPTYRESLESAREHFNKMIHLLSTFDGTNVKVAIKLHVGIILDHQQRNRIIELCNQKGHLFIENIDEVYSTFNDFDALLVDYSSIRVDFALTNKPIFLWRFDQHNYPRQTDVVKTFGELDEVSYVLSDNFSANEFISKYETDELKESRIAFVENELKQFSNGKSAERTIQAFLDVINQHK